MKVITKLGIEVKTGLLAGRSQEIQAGSSSMKDQGTDFVLQPSEAISSIDSLILLECHVYLRI